MVMASLMRPSTCLLKQRTICNSAFGSRDCGGCSKKIGDCHPRIVMVYSRWVSVLGNSAFTAIASANHDGEQDGRGSPIGPKTSRRLNLFLCCAARNRGPNRVSKATNALPLRLILLQDFMASPSPNPPPSSAENPRRTAPPMRLAYCLFCRATTTLLRATVLLERSYRACRKGVKIHLRTMVQRCSERAHVAIEVPA